MYLRLAEYRMPSHECRKTESEERCRLAFRSPQSELRNCPLGLTLIEMLIGLAITLIMMAAVVTLFANIGSGVRVQRAAMEMSSQLRVARARLYADLAGATCAPRPKLPSDDHSDGYIEIVEGIYSDKNPSLLLDGNTGNGELDYAVSQVPSAADPQIIIDYNTGDPYTRVAQPSDVTNGGGLGDFDDILALTVRSENEPFVGRGLVFNTTTNLWVDQTIESDIAEVVWYAIENPADGSLGEPGMRTVYRRVLLIAPWLGAIDSSTFAVSMIDPTDPIEFFNRFGISARFDTIVNKWIPNSLSDLAKRGNRFGHNSYDPASLVTPPAVVDLETSFPHNFPFDFNTGFRTLPGIPGSSVMPLAGDRQGEDLMLNDVLAFDLRVLDPGAPLFDNTGSTVEPSDLGWNISVGNPLGLGAYCDLGWNWDWINNVVIRNWVHPIDAPTPVFNGLPYFKSGLLNPAGIFPVNLRAVVYDTWSYHYETDGLNQDNDGIIDEGTDGLDTDGTNGVDIGERETSPPYDVPLRGIQVKLRVYEPDTRQIREATVTRGMVPQ